jgi:2-methylcitrate dehydratase PrpD
MWTKTLARFAAETRYPDLPPEVVEQAKLLMLDAVGCALAGYTVASEEVSWVIRLVKTQGGSGPATIFCDGSKTSPAFAALANSTMVHTVDFDDTHLGSIAHMCSSLVGSIFATAEQAGSKGREMIEAFVVGLDVGGRIGRSVMPSHYNYWHPTGTFGGIGSAVAAAKLFSLDAEKMELVIGHAADQAGGLRYCIENGDFSKSLHPGFAAMKGHLIAQVVRLGASGPRGLLEYPSGFCNAYSEGPNLKVLTEDLGKNFEVMADSIKCFPTINCALAPVQATMDLVKQHRLEADQIVSINVVKKKIVPGQGCNYNPETPLAGRLSIPFSLALAVMEGKVSLQQFTMEKIQDPKFKDFMKKVKIREDAGFRTKYPDTSPAFVDIEDSSGKIYSGSTIYAKGNPRNRMTPAEVQEKFKGLAGNTFDAQRTEKIVRAFSTLEKAKDPSGVISLLVK